MSHMSQVSFTVKNTPTTLGKQVYIILHGGQQNKVYQMDKANESYQKSIFVSHKVHYNYKYMVADGSQNKMEELGFRNFRYKKQDLKFLDYWNSKDVILRIQARQQSIIKGLQINAYQKINSEKQIKHSEIELKEIKQNGITKYYETIIYAESAMNVLEFQFFFNANKQDQNKQEQQFMKYYQQFYAALRIVGNQSFIEIDQKEFDKLSTNPIINKANQSFVNSLQNLPDNFKYSYELSYDKIKNLLQLYEASLQNFQEKLESKDKQIKDLQLEKLQQDEFILFNYQEEFQPDVFSEYQNEFYSIVRDVQKQQKSIFKSFNEKSKYDGQAVQEYKTVAQEYKTAAQEYKAVIQDRTKTIETLRQKVRSEKNNKEKNGQKIQQLEEEISKFQKILNSKKKLLDELEKQLNQEKQNNQEIIIEKEKFEQQVKVLDCEIKEFKRKNENLQKENQTTIQEKDKIQKLANEKVDQLLNIQSENLKLTQKQKFSQRDLEEAQQFIRQYNESSKDVTNKFKDIRNILIQLFDNNLKELKNIIKVHKEQEIITDIVNLTQQIAQIELGLKNLIEDKTTTENLEIYYQKYVHNQLQSLCGSFRIKEQEEMKIQNIQFQIIAIFEVLKTFGSIKDIVGKPKPILQRQTTEVSLKQIRSPYYYKIGVQRKATYQ